VQRPIRSAQAAQQRPTLWRVVRLPWRQRERYRRASKRFAGGGKRMRRVGIVALARRLVIALWKYLKHGEIPAGAVLKPLAG